MVKSSLINSAVLNSAVVWDDISQFESKIILPKALEKKIELKWTDENQIAMTRIESSDVAYREFREFYSNQWSYTTGYPEIRLSTIEWRDYNNGTLYNKFRDAIKLLENEYPSDAYWTITASLKNTNRAPNGSSGGGLVEAGIGALTSALGFGSSKASSSTLPTEIISTDDAILVKVSSVTLDQNADGEFLRFSTTFMHSGKKAAGTGNNTTNNDILGGLESLSRIFGF